MIFFVYIFLQVIQFVICQGKRKHTQMHRNNKSHSQIATKKVLNWWNNWRQSFFCLGFGCVIWHRLSTCDLCCLFLSIFQILYSQEKKYSANTPYISQANIISGLGHYQLCNTHAGNTRARFVRLLEFDLKHFRSEKLQRASFASEASEKLLKLYCKCKM